MIPTLNVQGSNLCFPCFHDCSRCNDEVCLGSATLLHATVWACMIEHLSLCVKTKVVQENFLQCLQHLLSLSNAQWLSTVVVNAFKMASVRGGLHFKFCRIIVNLNSHSALLYRITQAGQVLASLIFTSHSREEECISYGQWNHITEGPLRSEVGSQPHAVTSRALSLSSSALSLYYLCPLISTSKKSLSTFSQT